jgi:hypothetical protein
MASKKMIFLFCFIFTLQIALADQPDPVKNPGRFILRAVRLRNNPNMNDNLKIEPKPVAPQSKPQQKKLDTEQRNLASAIYIAPKPPLRPIGPQVRQSSTKLHSLSTMMKTVVNVSQLTQETTFEDAIDIIRNTTSPPLPILVFWRDIEENAFIDRSTPIGIDGFTKVQLRQVLKLVLMSVGSIGSELEYVNEGGIITIASKSMGLGDRKITKVYDIGELLSTPSMGMFGRGGGGMGGFGGGGMGNFGSGFGNSGSSGNTGSNNNGPFNGSRR